MTSEGPYPPGYEPADGAPPFGRRGQDRSSDWSPPPGQGQPGSPEWAQAQPPTEQFRPQQRGGPGPGEFGGPPVDGAPFGAPPPDRTQQFGPPPGAGQYGRPDFPSQPPPGRGYADQPGAYGGQPGGYGAPTSPAGYGAGPSGPPTGRVAGSASVSGAGASGTASVSGPGVYGSPARPDQQYPPPYGQPDGPQFGAPTQQYGGGSYGAGPGVYGGQGQGGAFGAGGAEPPYGPGGAEQYGPGGEPAKGGRRKGVIIGIVVAAVVVVAAVAIGVTMALSGGGNNYAVGSCVKQSGDKAKSVNCTDSGAYKIVNKTDAASKCTDQAQPYVVLQRSGSADQVLCLKPAK